jgi:hypothetical protein
LIQRVPVTRLLAACAWRAHTARHGKMHFVQGTDLQGDT